MVKPQCIPKMMMPGFKIPKMKMLRFSLLLCLSIVILLPSTATDGASDSRPSVRITSGEIVGEFETFSSDFMKINRKMAVYHGIPYAKPPVGEYRFKRPSPMSPWEGVYEANEMPPGCPQDIPAHLIHLKSAEITSETCLFLNVFVPIPTPINASVMVWFHGGEFMWGTGLIYPSDPLPLAAVGNVILVTVNYRLGVFGFLSTGDDLIPPNIGLYDQRASMKWVHENIAVFGGDPGKVTIFGNEAGAISVGWHLLSTQSRQYFQRAILQSGNPLDGTTNHISQEEALRRANVTASLVGCSFTELKNKQSLHECITETHVADLVTVGTQLADLLDIRRAWEPVMDNDFFPKPIDDLINKGGFQDVDIIIGANKNEDTHRIYELMGFPREKPFIDKERLKDLTNQLGIDDITRDILSILYAEDNFKYNDDDNYVDILSDIITDSYHTCSVKDFASLLQTAGSKVYMYQLTHVPQSESVLKFPWAGAGYMDNLQYIFGLPFQTDLPINIPEVERIVSAHFMRMWTNFVKTGDPNSSGDPSQPTATHATWAEYTATTSEYKEMGPGLVNGHHLKERECYAIKQVIPKLLKLSVELEELKISKGKIASSGDGNENPSSDNNHDEL